MAHTIKQAAEVFGCTYEATRQMVTRYSDELAGHIEKKGRSQVLDEYAFNFLKSKREQSPIIIENDDKSAELEQLETAFKALELKYIEALESFKDLQTEHITYIKEMTPKLALAESADSLKKEVQEQHDKNDELAARVQELEAQLEQKAAEAVNVAELLHQEQTRKLKFSERLFGRKKKNEQLEALEV